MFAMNWLLLIAACGAPEPAESMEPADGGVEETMAIDAIPGLTIEFPERGSFDPSGLGSVRGSVQAGSNSVARIEINGSQFEVGETGRFDAQMGWTPGIQILGARVESSNGERAVDGRSFYAGPTHEPDAWIEHAIRMEIDGEVLDDEVERDTLPIHDRLRLYHHELGYKTWLKVNELTLQRLWGD